MDRDGLDEAATDAELLAAARAGDRLALETLWIRHEAAMRRYARQLARPSDVDELVSESFYRVLRAILDGGGPDAAVRSYLLTTMRRVHVDLGRGYHQRVRLTGDDSQLEAGLVPSAAEVAGENAERGAAWQAWQSLPEDSRALLRQLIIEERTPAELAPLLGTTANGVASRGLRARERLRQAYLQQQLQAAGGPDCSWTRSRLGEYTRHALARREQQKVQQHLTGCVSCTSAAAELADLNRMLRTSIAPVLLGGLLLTRHRLAGARAILLTGSAAAAVLLVPLVTGPVPSHRQLAIAPILLPVGTSTAAAAGTTGVAEPDPVPTRPAHRTMTERAPVAGSRPTLANSTALPPSSAPPTRGATPRTSASIPQAVSGSPTMPAVIAPSRSANPVTTQPAGASVPDTRTPATMSSPAGVSRTMPFALSIGGKRWLPGVLTVTVPVGWTIDSLTSTGRVLPCSVESSTIADCQVSGPANRSYCFRIEATGPAIAGSDDRLIATYASSGVTLLDLELPLA